jgi:hypothetical protein
MTAEHIQQGPPLAAKPSWYVTRVRIPSFEQRHDLTTLSAPLHIDQQRLQIEVLIRRLAR